ncbi:glycosyltransferase family 2 protein, partial [Hydrogenimonas sp.]
MIDITIVIPCYNAEGKLHHIFESVTEALKYPYVEAIFVDDESTDGTLEILKDFSVDTRGNVEVYSIEKGGPGGARNYGLKKAKGKYVWFVDADDSIVPDTLEIVHTRIEEAFDFFEFAIVYDGIRTEKMEKKSGIFDLTNLDERIELMQNTGRLPNKIFKKELLLKHQLFYPENCFFEDNYLLFLLPIYVDTYYRSEKVAYNCRTNEDSITRTSLNSAFFDRMETASVGFQLAMQHSAPE